MDTITEKTSNNQRLKKETKLRDRYIINDTLGNGGFGITYEAWDTVLKIDVAVKEYFPFNMVQRIDGNIVCLNDSKAFNRGKKKFLEEARILASLNSRHIVKVYDHFSENGTSYIVMEYVKGVTLKKYIEANGPMPDEEIVDKFLPLMKELDGLHKNGVIHRDISPDNIMVSAETDELKLIDFGSAKDISPNDGRDMSMSVSQSVVKMNYSPLEMFTNLPKGPEADVYSLCATMYWCMTGKAPQASVDRAYEDKLVIPGKRSSRLGRVVYKGMSLKLGDRYSSVEAITEDLTRKKVPGRRTKIAAAACVAIAVVTAAALAIPKLVNGQEKIPVATNAAEGQSEPQQEESVEVSNMGEKTVVELESLAAAIAEAEEQFSGPVSVIKIVAASDDVSVSDYNGAMERMEARVEAITGDRFSIWQEEEASYVLLPNSILGQQDPDKRLRDAGEVLTPAGRMYFFADTDNYETLESGDIQEVSVKKDDQGHDELFIQLTKDAAEKVSGIFDRNLDVELRFDIYFYGDGRCSEDYGYHCNNLVRDKDDKTAFHCYGDDSMFSDAEIDIALGVAEIIETGYTGEAIAYEIVYIPQWENVESCQAPGKNQVSDVTEEALVMGYHKTDGYELEDLDQVIEEFKTRLDMLNVSYAFGQSAINPERVFVKVPQSQVPYETLKLLVGDEYDIGVGTPFWNTSLCELEATADGYIAAKITSTYALESIEAGLGDLSSGKVESQEIYLYAGGSKALAAELTEVPTEDSVIVFDRLLMQNKEGTWDGTGFVELISYLQTKSSGWNEITYFCPNDVEFANGAKSGYKIRSNREELTMLEETLKEDYPDVSVGYMTALPSKTAIQFSMEVSADLPREVLEAAEKVYELIKDGCVDSAYVYFIQEESSEYCYASFLADDYADHRMELLSFHFEGGRLEQYKDAFSEAYAASGFIKSFDEAEEEPQPEQTDEPQEIQQDEAGYNIFRDETYKIYCPYPGEFAVDNDAVGDDTMLMRAYSTENDNYVEVHAKKLDAAMDGSQALEASLKELGGTETYRATGEGWFACSTDKDGAGVYRKGLLKNGKTIMVWFDYHVLDSGSGHTKDIDYMEKNFSSGLG